MLWCEMFSKCSIYLLTLARHSNNHKLSHLSECYSNFYRRKMIGGKAVAKTKSAGFLVRMFNTQFNCLSGNQTVLPTGTVDSE